MSLVIAGASSLPPKDPTATLSVALRDFERILSGEQRLLFKSNYAKPGLTDVVAFVSRIDADNKSRAQKCVAPRLCSFLECAVQFTGIVDTFVQSKPAVAALVWGGLRTTILTASNYASYFEKITDMIMKIGRTSPSFQKFGELHPGSVGLQGALCEYYATIIRLCVKVIQVSQRSGVMHVLSPIFNPFETDFKPLLNDLAQNVKDVDIQITLASHKADRDEEKLAGIERKENRTHRHVMLRLNNDLRSDADQWRIERATRRLAKARVAVNKAFSPMDHVSGWRQAKREHLSGTADWFLSNDQYIKWSTSPSTTVMWCSGKLGSGKSIMMSNIVAKLAENQSGPGGPVSYFFCRTDESKSLTSRTMFGSIFRQLMEAQTAVMTLDELEALLEQLHRTNTRDLIDVVLGVLDRSQIYHIILDGLDECETAEIAEVAKAVTQLSVQSEHHLRIVYSARPEFGSNLFQSVRPEYRLRLSGEMVNEDIKTYIAFTLDRCLKEVHLVLGQPALFTEVADALQAGAQGM